MNNDRVYYSHDAEIRAMREITKLTVLCLTFGLGLGAVLALFFAPASGKRSRAQFAKTVEARLANGRQAVEPVVKRIEEDFADLRQSVEAGVTNLR